MMVYGPPNSNLFEPKFNWGPKNSQENLLIPWILTLESIIMKSIESDCNLLQWSTGLKRLTWTLEQVE